MKILKFKKDKGNSYKIYFEDDIVVKLYDDVIVKYNLLSNKVLDKKKFDEIIKYNSFLDGYYKSIKYINKKLRTEKEIRKYLSKYEVGNDDINKIIDILYKDGYLNKLVYLKAYINDQYNLTNNGPLKVKKELITLGYEESDILDYLYSLDWNSRIEKIINKKVKVNHKLSNNSLKTKILNDIIKMGYEKSCIMEYIESLELESDKDILINEMKKVKKKYGLKFSGNELEYKVISYLFKKGFNINEVKRYYDEV